MAEACPLPPPPRSFLLIRTKVTDFDKCFLIFPFYLQLIHLSTNNKCTSFSADSVTQMGTVRLAAQVPSPYADHSKYQSLHHLDDLKEPY